MKTRVWIMLIVFVLVITGCGPDAAEQPQEETVAAKRVEVFTVQDETEPISLEMTGIVEAKREALLSFPASGTIATVNVSKGSSVAEGEILATLDTRYYQSEVAAASSQVAEAAARKSQIVKGATPQQVEQHQLQLAGARNQLEKAKQDMEVSEKLLAGGAISHNEFQERQNAVQQAELQVRDAQLALEQVLRAVEPEEIAIANAAINAAASQVDRAQKGVEDAQMKAPFHGTILDVFKQAGEQIAAGEQMLHLVDLSEVRIALDVTSDVIGQYRQGQEVEVRAEDQQTSVGTISYLSPVIDQKTGKYRVEVSVDNPEGFWRQGMVARVLSPRQVQGFLVPLESVGVAQENHFVMAVEQGLLVKKAVQLGQLIGDRVEIVSGVQAGDQLLRSGTTFYVEGQRVEVKGDER